VIPIIDVKDLCKTYKYSKKWSFNPFKSKPLQRKSAVINLTFSIYPGEIVGYIGPNGAGKSTSIKMLTGILKPTSGTITVSGYDPFENRQQNAKNIGVLFGQRTQLWWDLPLIDTLELHRYMYKLPKEEFLIQLEWLFEILELKKIYKTPIRQLSFGQRMRCELAVTLLHKPSILYLDEPTIGMDVMVKRKIRQYLLEINKQENVTILLTSHDLQEIESICNRIIIINRGELLFDGTVEALRQKYMPNSIITLKCKHTISNKVINRLSNFSKLEDGYIRFTINKHKEDSSIISELYRSYEVIDLKITEPPFEDIVQTLYQEENKK
jgi:ABC-2 type transport system ATP-binding protein